MFIFLLASLGQVALYAVPVILVQYDIASYAPKPLWALGLAVLLFVWFFIGLMRTPDDDGNHISLTLFAGLVVGLTANAMVYVSYGAMLW